MDNSRDPRPSGSKSRKNAAGGLGNQSNSPLDDARDIVRGGADSLGSIVSGIVEDLQHIVRGEVQLAKTELKTEATKAGKGAGLLGGAGIAGNLFLVFVSLFVMFLLGEAMDLQWAALIVAAVWAVVAAVLGSMGRSQLKQVDPTLETTTQTLKEDAQWASTRRSS
jgi:uncharacterized membrane protein YqjE